MERRKFWLHRSRHRRAVTTTGSYAEAAQGAMQGKGGSSTTPALSPQQWAAKKTLR